MRHLYPISVFVVEDIKAKTKAQQRWDKSFSPLEVGKAWFYKELSHIAVVKTKSGWETKRLRDRIGLKKCGNKTANVFEAHAVDSWVLASSEVGGEVVDSRQLLLVTPIRCHRRQLHLLQPAKGKGGIRRTYGGTKSLGFRRGSYVKHPKYGVCYIGGVLRGCISLHSTKDGRRLCQNAKPAECRFLTHSAWKVCIA